MAYINAVAEYSHKLTKSCQMRKQFWKIITLFDKYVASKVNV